MTPRKSALDSAKGYEQKGRIDKAVEAYTLHLRSHPDDGRHWLRVAELKERLSDLPGAAEAYRALAKVWERSGFSARASAAWRQALRLVPTDLAAMFELSVVLASSGKRHEAAELLRE